MEVWPIHAKQGRTTSSASFNPPSLPDGVPQSQSPGSRPRFPGLGPSPTISGGVISRTHRGIADAVTAARGPWTARCARSRTTPPAAAPYASAIWGACERRTPASEKRRWNTSSTTKDSTPTGWPSRSLGGSAPLDSPPATARCGIRRSGQQTPWSSTSRRVAAARAETGIHGRNVPSWHVPLPRPGASGRGPYFTIAAGSAAEACAVLDLVDLPDGAERQRELRRVVAMTSRLR